MTEEAMDRVIDQLKIWQFSNSLHRRALEVIEELQGRIAAEQQAHEATIKDFNEMMRWETVP